MKIIAKDKLKLKKKYFRQRSAKISSLKFKKNNFKNFIILLNRVFKNKENKQKTLQLFLIQHKMEHQDIVL